MAVILTSIISVVIVLGIMILVHEWGHFIAARLFGVRVEIFSFGFGPRVWGRRRGPTDYRVSALPLGGYVKMAGDNPSEERAGAPDEFLSRPRWQRAIIAVAGPVMNIFVSVALIWGMFVTVGVPYQAYLSHPAQVVATPKDSEAARAGIQPGDRIVEIVGVMTPTWEQVYDQVGKVAPGSELKLLLERQGRSVELSLRATDPQDVTSALGYPAIPPVVDQVFPGMPADQAGLRRDDVILSINDQPIATWPQCSEIIRHSNGQPLEMVVQRGDSRVHLRMRAIQPRRDANWQIGMLPRLETEYRHVSFVAGMRHAVEVNIASTRLLISTVGQLFVGKVSLKQMQSIIGIAHETGAAVKRGPLDLIQLMAVLSLNLGVLNLLPIPILDGGHILMLTLEGLIRRDFSVTVKERFVQVGLVFLLVIFAIVMYNDVLRLLPNH